MKKYIYGFLILFSLSSFCQKQNSLLWEISGNGLTKNSYVYGTMHVSDKISYHLSDAFFKHLLEADIVSNESDPQTWDSMLPILRPNLPAQSDRFYQTFYQKPIDKKQLKSLFVSNNYFNSLLSGIDGGSADYQEDTVLDLFIFQTGKKYNKRIVGLENTLESILTVMKMKPEDSQPNEKQTEMLMKFMKGKNFKETMNDYYRSKDVVMLDSLYKLLLTKRGHQLMITQRNVVMANSIDSLSRTGSLFAAIGAAHLSGSEGVLQLLKNKGFKVTPIFDVMTKKGEEQKQTIESYFPKPNFKITSSADGMITLPLNTALIPLNKEIGSPDFTNGGVITVKRLPLHNYLNGKNENFKIQRLDSLFYENIPGKIIEKTFFDKTFAVGYDLKNTTKIGNSQHRKFYVTPLEIISVTMIGNLNYTKLYDAAVFDNIKLKEISKEWETFTPKKGGFSVTIPAYYTASGDDKTILEDLNLEAFDAKENAYYFLEERTLSTTNELENSEFEQKQIHYEYYLQNDLITKSSEYNSNENSFTSQANIGQQEIKLKSFVRGSHYYLLGTVNATDESKNKFFNSFNSTIPFTSEVFKTFTDTINHYSVSIPENTNKKYFLDFKTDDYIPKNKFSGKSTKQTFVSATGQTVELANFNFSKYDSFKDADEIREFLAKTYLKNYTPNNTDYDYEYDTTNNRFLDKKGLQASKWNRITENKIANYNFTDDKFTYDETSKSATFTAIISKENSAQSIKIKAIVYPSEYHILTTVIPKNYQQNNEMVETVFDSFKTLDSKKNTSKSILDLFIEDANSDSDTIRYSAINSIYYLDLTSDDFEKVDSFIENFTFKTSETFALNEIFKKIGLLDSPKSLPFLIKWYKKESILTSSQLTILETLAKRGDKQSYKTILELLEYDLPLSDEASELQEFFSTLTKNSENSKILFPAIFDYYNIPEYQKPILQFVNQLLDKDLVSAKKLRSFKKILLTNAKLEYKRVLSWKQNNIDNSETVSETVPVTDYVTDAAYEVVEMDEYASDIDSAPTQNLQNYLIFLESFSQDSNIKELLSKIKNLEIPAVNSELLRLQFINNQLSDQEIKAALQNQDLQFVMIQLLANKGDFEFRKNISDVDIAKVMVIYLERYVDKTSFEFIEKREAKYQETDVELFFYTYSEKASSYNSSEKFLTAIAFVKDENGLNLLAYKLVNSEKWNEEEKNNQLETMTLKFINEHHIRASFEKLEDKNDFFLYDDY